MKILSFFKRLWSFFWVFGRRRLEVEADSKIDRSGALTDAEKEDLKGAVDEALNEVKKAGDEVVERVEKKKKSK